MTKRVNHTHELLKDLKEDVENLKNTTEKKDVYGKYYYTSADFKGQDFLKEDCLFSQKLLTVWKYMKL